MIARHASFRLHFALALGCAVSLLPGIPRAMAGENGPDSAVNLSLANAADQNDAGRTEFDWPAAGSSSSLLNLDSTPADQPAATFLPIKGIEEIPYAKAEVPEVAAEKKAPAAVAESKKASPVNAPTELTEVQVVGLLEQALRVFTSKEGELRVVRVLGFSPIPLSRGDAITEVLLISPSNSSRFGTAMLSAKDPEERLLLRRSIRFEWEWKRPVWVAAEAQPSGPVQSEAFVSETRDVLNMAGEPVLTSPLPSSLVLIRPVGKGDPLVQTNIKPAIAVTKGAAVSAEFRSGALLVTMRAVALENGSVGQTIRVMNPSSRKELYGKVTHENVVEVTP